jgi:hypothetical protein
MGDMGDIFRGMREHSQNKREKNRFSSAKILRDRGIEFVSNNYGAHLIVLGEWDFWPGTGKYSHRKNIKYKRGIFNLLKDIKKSQLP